MDIFKGFGLRFLINTSLFFISTLILADNKIYSIDEINKIAIDNNIDKALIILNNKLMQENNRSDLHILKAKLFYWKGSLNKAKKEIMPYRKYNRTLYRKIYIAWAYKKLKNIKNINKKIYFINKLENFAKYSYDILWIYIDAQIKKGKLKKALYLTKKLLKRYPQSQEVQERLAQLLFWNKYYSSSLKCYKKLSKRYKKNYYKEIVQLKKAISNNKKQKIIKLVTLKNNKEKIIESSNREYMIGISIKRKYFSDKRYKDLTRLFETTFYLKEYAIYLSLQDTKRYNSSDLKIYTEIYPKLPKPQWGYISLSYSPNSNFFAKYSLGLHYYYDFKKIEIGMGVELSKYKDNYSTLLSTEYSYYLSNNLLWQQKLYFAPKSRSYAIINKIKYEKSKHKYIYISYSKSNTNENIENSIKFTSTKKSQIKVGFEYKLKSNYALLSEISKSEYQNKNIKYSNKCINFSFRYYW
jgi:YaiO family outer membrane protein